MLRCLVRLGTAVAVAGLTAQTEALVRVDPVRSFSVDGGTITAASFAPDGSALAVGGESGDVRVLDYPSLRERWSVRPSDFRVSALVYSPDGGTLACLGDDLTLHDVAAGDETLRIERGDSRQFVSAFAWADGGKGFAYILGSKVIVWDGVRSQTSGVLQGLGMAVAYGPEGLLVGDNVGRVWRFPEAGGAAELVVDHRADRSDRPSFLGLVCGGGVRLDVMSLGPLHRGGTEFATPGVLSAFTATSDAQSFAVGGRAKLVRWWSQGGERSRDLEVDGGVVALAIHPDGDALFVSTNAGEWYRPTDPGEQWLHTTGGERREVPPSPDSIERLVMSGDGSLLAVKTHVWSLHSAADGPLRELPLALDVRAGRSGAELLACERTRVVGVDGAGATELLSVPPDAHPIRAAVGPADLLLVGDRLVNPSEEIVTELRAYGR
ncbi:MAG: WD40 repeat domain-containing protein, partial [Myxococcota bacterium]